MRSTFKRRTAMALVAAGALLLTAGCSTGSLSGSDDAGGTDAGAADGGVTTGEVGVQSDIQDISAFCGKDDLTVALADGFGGNSWRKITRAMFEAEVAKCDNITKVLYTDAQGDTQKAISDINSLVAQGVDVIVTFVDGGEALLPTIKKSTDAGVAVVPYEIIEDSTDSSKRPKCEEELPADAILSSGLSVEQLEALFQ